jgi:hypothetical protein
MLLLLLECDCRRRNATILSNNFNRVENFGKEKLNGRVITGCVEGASSYHYRLDALIPMKSARAASVLGQISHKVNSLLVQD